MLLLHISVQSNHIMNTTIHGTKRKLENTTTIYKDIAVETIFDQQCINHEVLYVFLLRHSLMLTLF